jgi:hypothetical protein
MSKVVAGTLAALCLLTACGGDDAGSDAASSASSAATAASSSAADAASSAMEAASSAVTSGLDAASSAATQAASSASEIASDAMSSASSMASSAVPGDADGKATCEFLRKELPALQSVGSEIGAMAKLVGDYAQFVSEQPGQRLPNAAELDEVTSRECPDVRAGVLKVLGFDKFAGNL